ncbi:hypothetical protein IAI10_16255 [Clostridium sp. 19966]|uniref:hypothetical protein n=1 Tax=Clostridium sp. 19966 TaxID=2768166 RepID=UPI0028DD5E99|nr:hypothetical protein [Clostridium sp. 19966]MDT8718220.1 hypothetical protein [Clostridium sp. 19966]
MSKNVLNISNNNYGEYAERLGIKDRDSFNKFLDNLKEMSITRCLSGVVEYEDLRDIAKTLAAFDEITFDNEYISYMKIGKLSKLKLQKDMTQKEIIKWIYNGMIKSVTEMIDEDIRYDQKNDFLFDLRDFLCLIEIWR